jgi:hypothetical protein
MLIIYFQGHRAKPLTGLLTGLLTGRDRRAPKGRPTRTSPPEAHSQNPSLPRRPTQRLYYIVNMGTPVAPPGQPQLNVPGKRSHPRGRPLQPRFPQEPHHRARTTHKKSRASLNTNNTSASSSSLTHSLSFHVMKTSLSHTHSHSIRPPIYHGFQMSLLNASTVKGDL